jgi:hypothetical protein
MVLSETRGLQLFGVLRGGLELKRRLARRSGTRPSNLLETLPRTRRLGVRTTARLGRPGGAGIDARRLSCLRDQFLGVVAFSYDVLSTPKLLFGLPGSDGARSRRNRSEALLSEAEAQAAISVMPLPPPPIRNSESPQRPSCSSTFGR